MTKDKKKKSKKKSKPKNAGLVERNRSGLAVMSRMFDQIRPEEVNKEVKGHLRSIHELLLKIHRRRAHWEAYKGKTEKVQGFPDPPTDSQIVEAVTKVVSKVASMLTGSRKESTEKLPNRKSKKKSAK